jgi:hypothetical protein
MCFPSGNTPSFGREPRALDCGKVSGKVHKCNPVGAFLRDHSALRGPSKLRQGPFLLPLCSGLA